MHAAVATLTKQPIFLLSDAEGKAMSNALCDVMDFHEFNLTEASGAGGLYLALALTVFGIWKPKLDALKNGAQPPIIEQRATAPTSPMEAAIQPKRGMDFTGDVDPTTQGPMHESILH